MSGAPSWSPDGKRFVFGAGATPMLRDNRRDIYLADVAAKTVEKISPNFGSDTSPQVVARRQVDRVDVGALHRRPDPRRHRARA